VGTDLGLHEGEASQPGEIDLPGGEGFDDGGVVGNRGEDDLHAGLRLEILAERRELALQFGRRFVGNGRDAQDGIGGEGGEGKGGSEGAGQRPLQRQAARGGQGH